MQSTRHIAVIGAGTSGLTAIKCCKEESMAVTCFEKTDGFGGRWRYRKEHISGVASVMKSTVSVHSKEMSAFSDFPPPKGFPNYLHHTKMLEYLCLYAEKFDLISHIKYKYEVIRIAPSTDYDKTGKWLLTSVDETNGKEITEEFDGVMICTGRLSHPFIPESPNKEDFKGKIMHTQRLKARNDFENLNVLIVGNGNSAMEAAEEISFLAKQVYLSTRSGTWIVPKVGPKGFPFDMALHRRHLYILKQYFNGHVNNYVEDYLETKIQHDIYKLKPNHRALDKQLTINDIIPDKILTGRVRVKGQITKFKENGVIFEGDTKTTRIDVALFATGYELKIPILNNKLYKTEEGQINLFKKVFPIGLKHTTLAIIGFVESQGAVGPIAENQSRWAARIFSKKLKLPTNSIVENIKAKGLQDKTVSRPSIEDYVEYMDEVAQEYNAKPNMSTLLFKDPYLFWKCLTGPFLPYQYRINGPHAWNDARRVILDTYNRVISPLSTHFVANKLTDNNNTIEIKEHSSFYM